MNPTSIWTRILHVRENPDAVRDLVVRRYRAPIYEFARARGLPHEDAEDVAQEVFIQVCSAGFLEKADRQKGKFRALLLAVTRHVISSHRRHRAAARRDRRREVPIEDFEFPDKAPVDDDFDAAWAQNLLRVATERLGDDPSLDVLMTHLRGTTCRELADKLGKTEHAVEGLVYRVKERLRREVERVVADYAQEGELDGELADMLRLLMQERGRSR